METMTERSLEGTVDLDYATSGLTWRLTCPAANALEPGRAAVRYDLSTGRSTMLCQGT
jgi:hypothetical protein